MKANDREYLINEDIDAYQATLKGLSLKQMKNLVIVLLVAAISFIFFLFMKVPMFLLSLMSIFVCIPVAVALFFNIEGLSFGEFIRRKWQYAYQDAYCYESVTLNRIEKLMNGDYDPPEKEEKKRLRLFAKKTVSSEDAEVLNEMEGKYMKKEPVMFSGSEMGNKWQEDDPFLDDDPGKDFEDPDIFGGSIEKYVNSGAEELDADADEGWNERENFNDQLPDYEDEDDSYKELIGNNKIDINISREDKEALFPRFEETEVRKEPKRLIAADDTEIEENDDTALLYDTDEAKYALVSQEGDVIRLHEGENVIGRKRQFAEVILPNKSVSGKHAAITVKGKYVLIKDLGSKNGTYVDGFLIQKGFEIALHEGMTITFSNEQFQLKRI